MSVAELYEIAAQNPTAADPLTRATTISSSGALVAYSGKRTGYHFNITISRRSPKDKRVV